VDDALPVGMLQRRAELPGGADDHVKALRPALVQRDALYQFHHDVGQHLLAGCFLHCRLPGVVDGDDVGVVEPGGRAGFPQQAGASLGSQRRLAEHLDGDIPLQEDVVGAVDHPHPPLAELGIQTVAVVEECVDHRLPHLWRSSVPHDSAGASGRRQKMGRRR
jgi:hypothetical protein